MSNGRKAIIALVVAVLSVTAIIGTAFYSEIAQSNNTVNVHDKDSQSNVEVANKTSPTPKVENFAPANIDISDLVVKEYTKMNISDTWPAGWFFNSLEIHGFATNVVDDTAENAGLHVIAYSATNTLLIDVTVPLIETWYRGGRYGTTAEIIGMLRIDDQVIQLSTLDGGKSAYVSTTIYHEGVATHWTVTPVWTNSPKANQTPAPSLTPTPVPQPFNPTFTDTYTLDNTFLESGTYNFDVIFSYTGSAPQINRAYNPPVYNAACAVTITEASENIANASDVVLQGMPVFIANGNQLFTILTIPVASVVNNTLTFHITMRVNVPGTYNFEAGIIFLSSYD
jgi:uncharacterized membrane protein